MKETYFLLKENNTNDRDCVKYLEFDKDNDIRIHICGACFCGLMKENVHEILNNYENLTTTLTKEELTQLFEINNTWIDDRTTDNATTLYNIKKKLESEENAKLFEQVKEEEIEYLHNEYSLDYNDIEKIFNHYELEYRDRAVVHRVWADTYEIGKYYFDECHRYKYGFSPYEPNIDYEKFGREIINSDEKTYIELTDGRIVELNY